MDDSVVSFVKEEMMAAAEISQRVVKIVVDESDNVGRGLLAGAFAFAVLAKSAPVQIPLEDLHDMLDQVYRMVTEASDGESHVLQ